MNTKREINAGSFGGETSEPAEKMYCRHNNDPVLESSYRIMTRLPIDCFSDEKDHSVTAGFYGDYSPIEPEPPGSIPDWKEHIDYYIKRLKDAHYIIVGKETLAGQVK